jgi:hypothetical protein
MAKKPRNGMPRASALKAIAPRRTAEVSAAAAPAPIAHQSKYAVGDQVSHPMFGDGIVTAIDVDKLTIEFRNKVTKLILADYVRPCPR